MNKFTLILESNVEKESLYKKIAVEGSWLYKSNGLGMMSIIDSIFNEYGYTSKIGHKQVATFNKGLDVLMKTSMDKNYINSQLRYKLPNGIENAKMVLDENGDWHYVNKLNTNYSELSELLSDLIMRGIERNEEKGRVVYNNIMSNAKEGLLKIKPYLKKLLIFYYIENGKGLEDFKSFTNIIKKMSDIGELSEEKVLKKLLDSGFELVYQGGNGDFIDMIFGTDIIMYRNDLGYKTIQVKNRINWEQLSHYKVDWVAEGTSLRIFDRETRKELSL